MDDKLTIVGPGPSAGGQTAPARVNVEALLLMAKYDDEFRELLFADRRRALRECGIAFSESELRLLALVPREKLEAGIEEFSVRGIGRESLPSWKEAAAIVLLIMTMLVGPACQGSQDTAVPAGIAPDYGSKGCGEMSEADMDAFEYGWCDADTYRASGTSFILKHEPDTAKRLERARTTAMLSAQKRILEVFIGARIEAGGIVSDDYSRSFDEFKNEVKNLVGKGRVIAEKCNDRQECTVIFEISKPGLRRWVESM